MRCFQFVFRFLLSVGLILCVLNSAAATPVSDAGLNKKVNVGDSVILDGAGSISPDGSTLSYNWSVLSSPAAVNLNDPGSPNPTFIVSADGIYSFELTVVDADGVSSTDHVEFSTLSSIPIADAGIDFGFITGERVVFDAGASTSGDGETLTYNWTIVSSPIGSVEELQAANTPRPELTPFVSGDYILELVVTNSVGVRSAPDRIKISTNNIAPVSNAGSDLSVIIGQTAYFDPDGTIDADGDSLSGTWTLLRAPLASSTELQENAAGRFELITDAPGQYVLQLAVSDGEETDYDTRVIYVANNPEGLQNAAPLANAGFDQRLSLGDSANLSGIGSTDRNGDHLTYQWALIYRPETSQTVLGDASSVSSNFSVDVEGTYIAQLLVTDSHGNKGVDTVVISTESIGSVSNAGFDGLIENAQSALDGSLSNTTSGNLISEWSNLSVSVGTGDVSDPLSLTADINFDVPEDGVLTKVQSLDALEMMQSYNLISFGDLNSNVDTSGPALVFGNLVGGSATFGTGNPPDTSLPALSVAGNINGGAKSINNGLDVSVGGAVRSNVNLNGGGQIISSTFDDPTIVKAKFNSLSEALTALPDNSVISLPSAQPGSAILTATPGGNNIAVFSISDGNTLFKNNKVQQIELNDSGASAIIINVGGDNVNFNKGNFVGSVLNADISRKIIWNFYEASQVKVFRQFSGSILAPNAFVHNKSNINGTVIADRVLERARIGYPLFAGEGLAGDPGEPTSFALLQLQTTDASDLPPSYDSVILSTGNIRPVAVIQNSDINSSGRSILNASGSIDANGEPLTPRWSVISKPENSQSAITGGGTEPTVFTADEAGSYVLQLIVSDGELESDPVTVLLETINKPPVANAGANQTVTLASVVGLDGSASSDPEDDVLTYLWSITQKPADSLSELSDATSQNPEFVADIKGDYIIALVVNDGNQDSETDSVSITVPNAIPVAFIAPLDAASVGDTVMLNGAQSSDPDGDALSYIWTVIAPNGSSLTLNASVTAMPSFTANEDGDYTVSLVVNDGESDSAAVSTVVTAKVTNNPPVFETIGDQTVVLGETVKVQLSATDPDGDELSFFVQPIPLPAGVAFNTSTAQLTLSPKAALPKVFNLTLGVSDGIETRTEVVNFVVSSPAVTSNTLSGRIVDCLDLTIPVAGVTVMVGSAAAVTDADGRFFIENLAQGRQVVMVVPESGSLAPTGEAYASRQFTYSVIENANNVLSEDIGLPYVNASVSLDPANWTEQDFNPYAEAASQDPNSDEPLRSRFWRLRVDEITDPTQRTGFAEIEFRSEPNGPSLFDGGTIFASGTSDPATLVDGVLRDFWNAGAAGSTGEWVALDAGEGNFVTVREVMITSSFNETDRGQAPTAVTLQVSADGSFWQDIDTGTFTNDWGATETRTISFTDVPFSQFLGTQPEVTLTAEDLNLSVTLQPDLVGLPQARFWRVRVNELLFGQFPSLIKELDFRNETGDSLVGSGIPFASGARSGNPASNAFDGDSNSSWIGSTNGTGSWLAYDFGEANTVSVRQLFVDSRNSFRSLVDFDLQFSKDGRNWTTLQRYTNQQQLKDETRVFNVDQIPLDKVSLVGLSAGHLSELPEGAAPCQFFALEPKGAAFLTPIKVIAQNVDQLPAGTLLDVLALRNGTLSKVGTGRVESDGQSVVASLRNAVGGEAYALAPREGTAIISSDQPRDSYVPGLMNEGNLVSTISVPGYQSVGRNRGLSFVYNSTSAAPAPILSSDVSFGGSQPVSVSSTLEFGGNVFQSDLQTSLASGINGEGPLLQGSSLRQAVQLDAQNLPTGIYPYTFISVGKYQCSSVTQEVTGEIYVDNQSESPFGRGWTLTEVSKLDVDDDGTIVIREGNGVVSKFEGETDFTTLGEPVRLPASGPVNGNHVDLDNDGDMDILWATLESGGVSVYENLGDGTFLPRGVIEGGETRDVPAVGIFQPDIVGITTGDYDGDGFIDIAIATQFSRSIQIAFGKDNLLGFEPFKLIDDTSTTRSISTGDFNGDGIDDLLGLGDFTGSRLFLGSSTRNYVRSSTTGIIGGGTYLGVDVVDFDNDGVKDIIASNAGSFRLLKYVGGYRSLLEIDFSVNVSTPTPNLIGNYVEVADMNGDGRLDVVTAGSDEKLRTWLQNEAGSITLTAEVDVSGGSGEIALADVNRDGAIDVIMGGASADETPSNLIRLFYGMGDGNLEDAEAIDTGFPTGSPVIVDFNNDGSLDIAVDSASTDEVLVYFSDPTKSDRFVDPLREFTELIRNEDGSYTRTYTNGTVLAYNAEGLQTSVTDRNGNATNYVYDDEGRMLSITDPVGLVTDFTYGAGGKLARVDYPDGRVAQWEYNDAGDLIRYEDPFGDITLYDYDPQGRMTARTDARGFTTEHSYGPEGRYTGSTLPDGTQVGLDIAKTLGLPSLDGGTNNYVPADQRITTITDGRGNVTETVVNEYGSPIQITDPIGRVTIFERDERNLVTASLTPSSVIGTAAAAKQPITLMAASRTTSAAETVSMRRDEYDYDINGNVIAKREAVGTSLARAISYEYEPEFSKITKMIDADGFETLMTYNGFGDLLTETDPENGVMSYTYNGQGLVETMTDERENVTQYIYDNLGRKVQEIDASGTVMRYTLDDFGNQLEVQEDVQGSLARTITRVYDAKNRLVSETAADGGVTSYVYDGTDNVVSVTDPTGIVETRSYDDRDRLEIINDPAMGASVMAYDVDDNLIRVTDALGETTEASYDAVNRMLSTVDAKGQLRAFDYDLRDNIRGVTDARANVTFMTYDALDRPVSRTNPKGETWRFSYDARDNRLGATKPDGVVITAAYDGLSRMLSLASTASANGIGAITRNYSYDAFDNITAANDTLDGAAGADLAFSYDSENRVASASTSGLFGAGELNNTHSYLYDAHDQRREMSDSFGGLVSYLYDPVDRLAALTTPQGDLFETNYDLAGRTLGRAAPNVTDMLRQYEVATGRLSSQVQRNAGTAFNAFDYDYTARGNISSISEGGEVVRAKAYNYDELERLTEVSVPDAPQGTSSQEESYTLDPEGNRITSHLSDAHVTDEANRLTSDDRYTYVYDLNGNLISKLPKASAPAGTPEWGYLYDALDQLIVVTRSGLPVESYRYDAFGRRSLITRDGQAPVGIINDGSDRAIDVVFEAGTTHALRRYTHSDNVDEPFQLETFDAAGTFDARYTYHTDHLGSVRFLTDALGTVVNAYDYDSYGQPVAEVEGVEQPFRFTGREWDEAAQLYHYRARAYDPSTGVFIQEDPIWFEAGDLNVQRYVGNNPLNYTDPSGMIEAAIAVAGQAEAIISAYGPIADAIKCKFLGMASIFEGLNEVQSNGGVVVDVDTDLSDCSSNVVAAIAPWVNTNNYDRQLWIDVRNYFRGEARREAINEIFPRAFSQAKIFATATPAYPSTWRGRGPKLPPSF